MNQNNKDLIQTTAITIFATTAPLTYYMARVSIEIENAGIEALIKLSPPTLIAILATIAVQKYIEKNQET